MSNRTSEACYDNKQNFDETKTYFSQIQLRLIKIDLLLRNLGSTLLTQKRLFFKEGEGEWVQKLVVILLAVVKSPESKNNR